MSEAAHGTPAAPPARLDFDTAPDRYRHWRLAVDGSVARLTLAVDEAGGAFGGYELKLNSYDIGVDIELADAINRLRFEHPEVGAVVVTSGLATNFCAGANIRMLAGADHSHKVNFCKFTNETRLAMEDATTRSRQRYIAALNGTAAGGGYELALATDYIVLVDDGNAAVSLPEVPLLAVLPGTGGLTRLVDKRGVRRDVADLFCTTEEGFQGSRALTAQLVDEVVAPSTFDARVSKVASTSAAGGQRPPGTPVRLRRLDKVLHADAISYSFVQVDLDRASDLARVVVRGPDVDAPETAADAEAAAAGRGFWPLTVLRELDDALLELRFNEPDVGTLVLETAGDEDRVLGYQQLLDGHTGHWFLREVTGLAERVFTRLDLTARSTFALLLPGSCFAGFLAELVLAADRAIMLDGVFEDDPGEQEPATMTLTEGNFGAYPMLNGLNRLASRFIGEPGRIEAARRMIGRALTASDAESAGLITLAFDDLDWDDEVRLMLEARSGFSPDALTAMEANLRFAGPETMQTKIFARLSAWQNWVFQRPNAVGPGGALPRYGSGRRPDYDRRRT